MFLFFSVVLATSRYRTTSCCPINTKFKLQNVLIDLENETHMCVWIVYGSLIDKLALAQKLLWRDYLLIERDCQKSVSLPFE